MSTSVYLLDVSRPPQQAALLKTSAGLSVMRQEKIRRMRFEEDRLLSLGAGLLMDIGLSFYGLSERDAVLEYRANGKPYLKDRPELFFNLSHSGAMAMAVFSDRETGCDVEQIKPARLDVARRFFTEQEADALTDETLSEAERNRLFARYWTIKESVLKVTGEGMRLPLNRFFVSLPEPVSVRACREEDTGFFAGLSFLEYSLPGYQAAVCLGKGKDAGSEVFFSFQKLQDVVR
ncbi:MAG: 4'-phosphopantetheinyl transferase superfamily protein [Eubacteriales bacterium]|nr:4'-phosphopantetheinyl transferase superfamily protein [Eubacteriales bacterium]